MGGAGNALIGGAWGHSKRATLTVESATYSTDVMALQNGTNVECGSQTITAFDILDIDSDFKDGVKLKHTPISTGGYDIGYVYLLGDDGSIENKLIQGDVAISGQFICNNDTLYFADGDVAIGDKVCCSYSYTSSNDSTRITNKAGSMPKMALITAIGVAKDICSGDMWPCQLEGLVQIGGASNLDLSADGDTITQSITMEFVTRCNSRSMYQFVVYPQDEYRGALIYDIAPLTIGFIAPMTIEEITKWPI